MRLRLGWAHVGIGLACIIVGQGAMALGQEKSSTAETDDDNPSVKVDALFQKMDTTMTPGCALAVMRDGKIIYERGYGMADLDHNVPITPTTVFHVASISKQFTAAAVVLLAQQGKLGLDDPVRKYVPEVPDFGVPITIRELVHHTSGLRDQGDLLGLAGWRSQDLVTNEDVLSLISRQRGLNFPPNTKYMYNSTEYTLLAQVVKHVSGMSLRDYTSKNIFEPLGMNNTHFRDDHSEIVKNIAYGYEPYKGTFKIGITNFDAVGATGLLTTVEDLALWDENFYNPKTGGRAFLAQMLQQGKLNNGEQVDYAFGLGVNRYRGLRTVGHAGEDSGYRSDIVRFPDQHLTATCLCNRADAYPSDLDRAVAEIYLSKEMKPAEASAVHASVKQFVLTPDQVKSKMGTYVEVDGDQVITIEEDDGRLQFVVGAGDETIGLRVLGENHFQLADLPVDLTFAPLGSGLFEFTLLGQYGNPRKFDEVSAFRPTAAQLGTYTGAYRSSEIDTVYTIKLEEGILVLHRVKQDPDKLHSVARDFFLASIGDLRFQRNAEGEITGFELSRDGIKNMQFEKTAAK